MAITDNTISPELGKGKIAEGRKTEVDSRVAEEDQIDFGTGLVKGTNKERQVVAFDGSSDAVVFDGIAGYALNGDIDNGYYEKYDRVSCIRKGIVWVEVDADSSGVEAGDKVAYVPSGNIDAVSNLTEGSGGTYFADLSNVAEIKSNGDAGDLVKVEIDLPGNIEIKELA